MTNKKDSNLRIAALSIITPILKLDTPYRERFATHAVSQELGISEDEALQLVAEYSLAKCLNSFSGNIRELPFFDPDKPPTEEIIQNELYRRTVWFTLGYVEDAMGIDNKDAEFQGKYWLGNTVDDTKALINHLQQNPSKVASYLGWAFPNNPGIENMLNEFSKRAANNTLRPPSFKE